MESLRQIYVTLGLDWDQAGFASALNASAALEWGAKKLVEAFKALPQFLASAVQETANYGSAVNDAAARTGVGVVALQEYAHAAKLSGSDAETMFSVLTKLANTMSNAAGGSKEAAAGFAQLGVKVTNAEGKLRPVEEVFDEVAARLGEIENPTDRAGKAFDVFSKQAQALLPMFAEGEKGLEAMRSQFHDLGIGMSVEGVAAADAFGDSMDTVLAVLASFKRDLGEPLMAALMPVIEAFLQWVMINRELIRSRIGNFAQLLINTMRGLWKIMSALVAVAEGLAYWWKLLAMVVGSFLVAKFVLLNATLLETLVAWGLNTVAAIAYGAVSVAAAGKAALAWLAAAAPVVLMTAALLAAVLVAEDIYGFFTGADSVLGSLGRKWAEFLESWLAEDADGDWLVIALKSVIWLLSDITDRFPKAIAEWKTMIVDFFTKTLPQAARDAVAKLPGLFDPLSLHGRSFGDAMREKFPGAAGIFPGGAASPEAAGALSSSAQGPGVLAPRFNAQIQVVTQPGQNNEAAGVMLEEKLNSWWDVKIRETVGTSGGE